MKTGFVTIVGKPNSGKSSLMNCILKEHICITSKKPQTTRKNAKGIYNDDECQIVFIDTPGVHNVKDDLDKYMEKSIKVALNDVDVVIVLVDIVEYKKLDDIKNFINEVLKNKNKNTNIVVGLNKIDLLTDDELNKIKNELDNNFSSIVYISCLKKRNIDGLINKIKENLKEGLPYYPIDSFTDLTEKEIVGELVREQCLYKLEKEIPHGIATKVNNMTFKNNKCIIDCDIICTKENHKGIIIGKGGSMLKNIGFASRVAIEKLLGVKVYLNLKVLVKENWKEDYSYLKDIGYNIKDL